MGLVAAWREGLLAKKVLEGNTKGYKNHPQLNRFKKSNDSINSITRYLAEIYYEAKNRGYKFDKSKIDIESIKRDAKIEVTRKQIQYEYELLKYKILKRDKVKYLNIKDIKEIEINGLFKDKEGEIESWEKVKPEIIDLLRN